MTRPFLVLAAVVTSLLAASCTTTSETASKLSSSWVGKPADAFFSAYGPPRSSFPLQNGGAIYTWRGGETTIRSQLPTQRPKPFKPFASDPFKPTPPTAPSTGWGTQKSRTEVKEHTRSDGTFVRETKTTSSGVSIDASNVMGGMFGAKPAAPQPQYSERHLSCELQITADPAGTITAMSVSKDTQGEFVSLSRCGDLFSS